MPPSGLSLKLNAQLRLAELHDHLPSAGQIPTSVDDVTILPWNDESAVRDLLTGPRRGQIAAALSERVWRANVRGVRPEELAYEGAATALRDVFVALRANVRAVLEEVTLAAVAAGELPEQVRDVLRDPQAWAPH